ARDRPAAGARRHPGRRPAAVPGRVAAAVGGRRDRRRGRRGGDHRRLRRRPVVGRGRARPGTGRGDGGGAADRRRRRPVPGAAGGPPGPHRRPPDLSHRLRRPLAANRRSSGTPPVPEERRLGRPRLRGPCSMGYADVPYADDQATGDVPWAGVLRRPAPPDRAGLGCGGPRPRPVARRAGGHLQPPQPGSCAHGPRHRARARQPHRRLRNAAGLGGDRPVGPAQGPLGVPHAQYGAGGDGGGGDVLGGRRGPAPGRRPRRGRFPGGGGGGRSARTRRAPPRRAPRRPGTSTRPPAPATTTPSGAPPPTGRNTGGRPAPTAGATRSAAITTTGRRPAPRRRRRHRRMRRRARGPISATGRSSFHPPAPAATSTAPTSPSPAWP